MPSTIRLHRVFTAPPERVYKAFVDPEAKVKWLPPYGFTAKVHHMDARVGGTFDGSLSGPSSFRAASRSGSLLSSARTALVAAHDVHHALRQRHGQPRLRGPAVPPADRS